MARPLRVYETPSVLDIVKPQDLAGFVRARRTQSGLRIDDAAELCGVSVETLSKIETAKAGVNAESLFKVLNGLGIQLRVKKW
ncbi:MAG TPA: helix-turn-helix transcriptional regulator [Pseudobdellovibrionaceae bacterium]|nr:helix-turn-helix transcriptional regulator [Pseudobdellovibrionaceae bacterium]